MKRIPDGAKTLNWLKCRAKWREEDARVSEKMFSRGLISLPCYLAQERAAEEAWEDYFAALESITDASR